MSIKKLSNLLDSNPIQSKSSKKTNIEPENSIESDPLKPEKTREFELYSNDVIKSKHSKYKSYPEDQFTNFLNEDVVQNFVNNINLFWPDLKKLMIMAWMRLIIFPYLRQLSYVLREFLNYI